MMRDDFKKMRFKSDGKRLFGHSGRRGVEEPVLARSGKHAVIASGAP